MQCLRLLMSCAAAAVTLLPGAASAQEAASAYPSKPAVVILSFAAGGFSDKEARLYATKLSAAMGQPFLLDFKPGAAGTIGAAFVAKAKSDGYTLLIVTGSFTTFPALYKGLPFDVNRDFAPVSLMSQRASVLLVSPAFPAKNFAGYIAQAKASPGKINYGTVGAGGVSHLAGAWLHSATGTRVTFVHYKGASPLMLDLMEGRMDVTSTALLGALPLIKSGKARVLAVMNDRRAELLPGVPTVAEQAIPGFDYSTWLGIAAPGATTMAIVNKLSEALVRIAKAPEVIAALEAEGSTMVGSTPAQFRQLITAETERWQKVVRDSGIKLDE